VVSCAQSSADAVPLSLGVEDFAKSLACMLLAGPLLTGYTQTINDWYDRDIDAINEPYRPIPSGRISEGEVRKGGDREDNQFLL
jgi:4-hydroxybenzoate polyprenyltransferase